MNDEGRFAFELIDFVHGRLKGAEDVAVRRVIKTDVAIADLHEAKVCRRAAGRFQLSRAGDSPEIAYTIPVPAHAIHSKKPRRLIPSVLMIGSFCCLACPYRPPGANIPGNFLPIAQV